MIVYRNTYSTEDDSSTGFKWFATRSEALKVYEQWALENDADNRVKGGESFNVPATKHGLVEFLNQVARHPDNG